MGKHSSALSSLSSLSSLSYLQQQQQDDFKLLLDKVFGELDTGGCARYATEIFELYEQLRKHKVMCVQKHLMVAAVYHSIKKNSELNTFKILCTIFAEFNEKKLRQILKRFSESVYSQEDWAVKFYPLLL